MTYRKIRDRYSLLVLHKLEHSLGIYDVGSAARLHTIATLKYPHEICLDPTRQKAYIAEMGVRGIESEGPGGHTIAVFDPDTREILDRIDTGVFDRPHGIAAFGDRLYVTSESTRHLLVFDLKTEKMRKAVRLDQECAHMVGVAPGGERVYTANIHSNSVTAVDSVTLDVLYHIPVPERPEGMAFSPDGRRMYVVCREDACVALVDQVQGKMTGRIETGKGPVRIAVTPGGDRLVVPLFHSGAVEIVDTAERRVIHRISVGPHPAGTCLSPGGKLAFVSCEDENRVYVIDLGSLQTIRTIPTGKGADAMVCLFSRN